MSDSIITIQELKDAQKDAKALGLIINSPAWQKIATRLGLDCYSIVFDCTPPYRNQQPSFFMVLGLI